MSVMCAWKEQCVFGIARCFTFSSHHHCDLTYPTSFSAHTHNSLPEGVTMDQLLDVLGETRLKKMARKNRRSRNQQIREGKLVLNEQGEWVDRE